MKLSSQKKLASRVLKAGIKRVSFDPERLEDIKEAITKTDIRGLISEGAIKARQKKGVSRVRVRLRQTQRRKGLQKGPSTKKGKKTARISKKDVWMAKVRTQRTLIKSLRDNELIERKTYTELYLKVKGNFFRSKRHIQIYLQDHNLIKSKDKK